MCFFFTKRLEDAAGSIEKSSKLPAVAVTAMMLWFNLITVGSGDRSCINRPQNENDLYDKNSAESHAGIGSLWPGITVYGMPFLVLGVGHTEFVNLLEPVNFLLSRLQKASAVPLTALQRDPRINTSHTRHGAHERCPCFRPADSSPPLDVLCRLPLFTRIPRAAIARSLMGSSKRGDVPQRSLTDNTVSDFKSDVKAYNMDHENLLKQVKLASAELSLCALT